MSGRRIDDHSFWAGRAEKGGVFPDGEHKLKQEHSAEGSGHLGSMYPDTTEQIHRDQMHADSKVKARPMKTGYRY
jgi:hypothetical protein